MAVIAMIGKRRKLPTSLPRMRGRLPSVHLRHLHVQQQEVEDAALERVQCFGAAR